MNIPDQMGTLCACICQKHTNMKGLNVVVLACACETKCFYEERPMFMWHRWLARFQKAKGLNNVE